MSNEAQTDSSVTVEKTPRGQWVFVLKHRGVTYPAQGRFGSMLQAQAAGMAALNILQSKR